MMPPTIELIHGTVRAVVQTYREDMAYIIGSRWHTMSVPKASCLRSSFRKFTIHESLIDDFEEVFYSSACEGDLEGTIHLEELEEDEEGNVAEIDYEIDWKASGPLREQDIEEEDD